mmetsp:Transcript_36316/g.81820  ORF Transcript_36316/g.81820 Transcript_36316/m.81820 type:complete len:203 (-) Transcript_36316:237-845(-)
MLLQLCSSLVVDFFQSFDPGVGLLLPFMAFHHGRAQLTALLLPQTQQNFVRRNFRPDFLKLPFLVDQLLFELLPLLSPRSLRVVLRLRAETGTLRLLGCILISIHPNCRRSFPLLVHSGLVIVRVNIFPVFSVIVVIWPRTSECSSPSYVLPLVPWAVLIRRAACSVSELHTRGSPWAGRASSCPAVWCDGSDAARSWSIAS